MNFFDCVHETQITRRHRHSTPLIPLHRRLFPLEPDPREIARRAVREVLG